MLNLIPYPNYVKELGGNAAFDGEVKVIQGLAEDEYHINCVDGVAQAFAGGEQGVFYALKTIEQLKYNIVCKASGELGGCDCDATDSANSASGDCSDTSACVIPAVEIKDKPSYSYRGFMLDCARHFWTVEKIKQFLDVMAACKQNYFHWHLTEDQGWRAEIKKYPLLTEKGSIRAGTPRKSSAYKVSDGIEYGRGLFYTQEQMKEVVAYAKERHIEVIPEIDMPGHLVAAIACYPNLSCKGEKVEVSTQWGILDNIGCCGKEDIFDFVKDVIDELGEIFPCEYFHIGGDEVPKTRWKECPACQAKIKELGLKDENALQGYFNNRVCEYLKSKGKKMIGWNEILESSEILDKDVITQYWIEGKHHADNINKRIKDGGKILMSIWSHVYMDHPYLVRSLGKTYSLSHKTIGLESSQNIIGVEAPQWTEYVASEEKLDFNTYPRLIAMSEVGWTDIDNRDYASFEARLENMRKFFKAFGGLILPSKKYYNGQALKFMRYARGWKKWRQNPNFELEMWQAE